MKYKKEIDELIKDVFMLKDMSQKDYDKFLITFFNEIDFSYESMSKDMEIAVAKGYPVDEQIEVIKVMFKAAYLEEVSKN